MVGLGLMMFACAKSNDNGGAGGPVPPPPYCGTYGQYGQYAQDPRCVGVYTANATRAQLIIDDRQAYNNMLTNSMGTIESELSPMNFAPVSGGQGIRCISGAGVCETECNNYTGGSSYLYLDLASGNQFGKISLKTGPYYSPLASGWKSIVGALAGVCVQPQQPMYYTVNYQQLQYQLLSGDPQGRVFVLTGYGQGQVSIVGYQPIETPSVQIELLFNNRPIAHGTLFHY